MTANEVCTAAIDQRPAIRLRTSRSARLRDSAAKRSASAAERPIVLPSRIPDTLSDSCTSEEMSAIARLARGGRARGGGCRRGARRRRRTAARRGEKTASRQSSSDHRDRRRDHRRHVLGDRRRGRGDDVLHAADVVGDARLHLAGARAGEEGQRQPLQVPVDGGAQVVHDPLADVVGQVGLADAEHAGGDRDGDHPADQLGQQLLVALGQRVVEDLAQQERRDHAQARAERRSAPRTAVSGRRYGRKSAMMRRPRLTGRRTPATRRRRRRRRAPTRPRRARRPRARTGARPPASACAASRSRERLEQPAHGCSSARTQRGPHTTIRDALLDAAHDGVGGDGERVGLRRAVASGSSACASNAEMLVGAAHHVGVDPGEVGARRRRRRGGRPRRAARRRTPRRRPCDAQ